MDTAKLLALGKEPVPGAAPAGPSVRYEPDFEQLSAEIEKLTSVEQKPVDWARVVQLSSDLLRRGKDLLVGSYLACGLLEREGYPGFATGCVVLQSLVDTFWEGLFPELRRLRARIAAFEWLASRLEKMLAARGDPKASDQAAIEQAIAALEAIAADPQKRFGSEGPNLAPAIRALRGKLAAIPKPQAAPPPPPPKPAAEAAPPPPPPPPPPPKPVEATDPKAVAEALVAMRKQQGKFAGVLRTAEAADPRAYALLREAQWSEVPAAAGGNKVPTTVGDAAAMAPLRAALDAGEYEKALGQAEALFAERPFWLDLQLVAVQACDGLGRRFARVRDAIVAALAFLLQRHPHLPTAETEKGVPLAARETRVWLDNEVLAPSAEAKGAADPLAELASEARKLVARGKLGDAMRLLTGRIDATASRRGRFALRLELGQLCIEAGRIDLAVPQLEQLDQEVTRFSLEEWEPELATAVVRSLWQCCAGQKPAPSLAARSQDIYARLCRLDPAAAVSATGPQGS